MLARFAAVLAALLIVANPALAAPADAVMNKEGYWAIDVDGDRCVASMTLQGGATFLFHATAGEVALGLFSRTVLPKGKTLGLEVDGGVIDLPASFGEDHDVVFLNGTLEASSLARLRAAHQLRVLIDGRSVAAMNLEGTGFPDAVDSVIACSHGQAGWWGKGVPAAGATPAGSLAYNKEDVWLLAPMETAGVCIAQAEMSEKGRYLQFLQRNADLTIAVWSSGSALRRGRKGVLAMDGASYDFTPNYDSKTFMVIDGDLAGEPMTFLRATTGLAVNIDGKPLIDARLDDTGFPRILDDLAACARGETGWWTPNAKVGR